MTKFYASDQFGLVIDVLTMADQLMHGSGKSIMDSKNDVQLEIQREAKGSGEVNCHIFVISDAQFNINGGKLTYVWL